MRLNFYNYDILSFIVSAALLGSTIGGIVTLIQAKASHQVPPLYISVVIGFISVFYAVGQMLGPLLVGALIEYDGGFAAAYLFGAAVYLIGLLMELRAYDSRREGIIVKPIFDSRINYAKLSKILDHQEF